MNSSIRLFNTKRTSSAKAASLVSIFFIGFLGVAIASAHRLQSRTSCSRSYGEIAILEAETHSVEYSALHGVPNLAGRSREAAVREIESVGFAYRSTTAGGYVQYRHADGSIIWIRPNGEVTRSGPKVKSKEGKSFNPRYDQFGRKIESEQHSTGEFLLIN